MSKRKAKQVFERLLDGIMWGIFSSSGHRGERRGLPGEVINSIRAEDRKLLRHLTSDDIGMYGPWRQR